MRSGLRWGAALLMVLCVLAAAGAQEVSEKKDIAVFNLSYSDYSIPSGALGLVDQSIQNVFIELGRFNIIGMKYRLELNEIDEFISKIKELKQENVEVPEEVRLGEETFTEADFNKLVGSFIVVVPVMSYYNVYEEGNDYQAEIQTSFTFIKVDTAEAFASFQIDTSASGENSRKAVKSAVDMIPIQLQYELRSIPEFQLKTAIIDVAGNKYIMEFGRNMGVQVGDEYVVTRDLVLPSGYTRTEEVGLFVIKNVSEQVSTAKRVYSSERTGIGDQMVEVPRLGVNATIYGHYLPVEDDPGTAAEEKNRFVLGLRGVGTRGFYNWRPVAGVEVPLGDSLAIWFPVIGYAGVEYNVRIGRLSLVPSGVVGVGSMVPIIGTEEFKEDFDFVSSFGGTVQIAADYLINRDTKINLYAGYSMYISLFDDSLLNALTSDGLTNPAAVQGSFIGAGITFKL
jgi:hypothetical protein